MRGLTKRHRSRRIEPLTPDQCDMLGKIGDAGNLAKPLILETMVAMLRAYLP